MQSRTAVVTGASRGIGLSLVRQLSARGDKVVAACRKTTPELFALEGNRLQIAEGIDVATEEGAAALASAVGEQRVDVLLLNAGILEQVDGLDLESIERQLQVNALGPLRIVKALTRNLAEGSKIAIVTSRMGSISDNSSGGYYGYRMSKAAVNMAGVSLALDLKPKKISVILLHPGYVRTEMTGGNGDVDPATSAEGLIARIDELSLESSGRFVHANGSALTW